MILECLYIFSVERDHQLSTYAAGGGWGGGVIQNACSCVQGQRVSRLMCMYALTLSFLCFLKRFCLIVSCFVCRNFTLPLFKKDMCVRDGYFFPAR